MDAKHRKTDIRVWLTRLEESKMMQDQVKVAKAQEKGTEYILPPMFPKVTPRPAKKSDSYISRPKFEQSGARKRQPYVGRGYLKT